MHVFDGEAHVVEQLVFDAAAERPTVVMLLRGKIKTAASRWLENAPGRYFCPRVAALDITEPARVPRPTKSAGDQEKIFDIRRYGLNAGRNCPGLVRVDSKFMPANDASTPIMSWPN
jgi:hypothetical protein